MNTGENLVSLTLIVVSLKMAGGIVLLFASAWNFAEFIDGSVDGNRP